MIYILILVVQVGDALITGFQVQVFPQWTGIVDRQVDFLLRIVSQGMIFPLRIFRQLVDVGPIIILFLPLGLVFEINFQLMLFFPVEGMFIVSF